MSQELSRPEPFSRAYRAIRGDLAAGNRAPGSQIRVDQSAQAMGISPTPVREALAMLAGERLVRGTRRQGYFVPQPSAGDLIELFTLCEVHLLTAIRLQSVAGRRAAFSPEDLGDPHPPIARVFLAILAGSGATALLDSGALIVERLASARLAETAAAVAPEGDEIARLFGERRLSALASAVRVYHRTRRAKAVEIAQAIAAAGSGHKYFRNMI